MPGEVDRWSPDENLVAAVLANGTVRMSSLSAPDRCWVVAGLKIAGLTASDTADRLGCSVRLVREVRAKDMTLVCERVHSGVASFEGEARLLRSERRVLELALAAANRELERSRAALAAVIDGRKTAQDAVPTLCRRCGTPMDRYNTYVEPVTGARRCRQCRREYQRRYLHKRKLVNVGGPNL